MKKHCGFCEKHLKNEKHNEKHQKQLLQHRSLIWTWCFIEYRGKANWVYLIFWWYLVVHMCLVVHVCVCGACMVMYVFGDICGVCICILYMVMYIKWTCGWWCMYVCGACILMYVLVVHVLYECVCMCI